MNKENAIKLFNDAKVRVLWDSEKEKWYFSVVDVIAVLTNSIDPNAYWRKLKERLKKEGNETVTNCHALKMIAADGKMRLTDVADTEQLLRLIQSVPSPNAEPFKMWLAKVGIANQGGVVAGNARNEIEQRTGKKVITGKNAKEIRKIQKGNEE